MDETLKQLGEFIKILLQAFGPWGTVILIGIFVGGLFLWRLYSDYRKDHEIHEIIKEKDRTIQRLANETRRYRKLYFKKALGFSDEEIKNLIDENDFENIQESRRTLENETRPSPPQQPRRTNRRN